MRHYRHIGLASMAGSAILVCVIAVILLPIIIRHLSTGLSKSLEKMNEIFIILDDGNCVTVTNSSIGSTTSYNLSTFAQTGIVFYLKFDMLFVFFCLLNRFYGSILCSKCYVEKCSCHCCWFISRS